MFLDRIHWTWQALQGAMAGEETERKRQKNFFHGPCRQLTDVTPPTQNYMRHAWGSGWEIGMHESTNAVLARHLRSPCQGAE